jgi:soluble cytochrome b562
MGRNAPVGDSVAALLGELSQSDLTRLLAILETLPRSADDARLGELLRAAADAAAAQNSGRALDLLRQFASLDPARAETLVSAPALQSIRPGVEELLGQLTAAARLHAEGRIEEAAQKVETATVKEASAGEVRSEIFLLVATRLMEAGGLANYVRSAAVSEALIDQCRWAPALHAEPAIARPADLWRISLRLLIWGWFALGIAGAGLCWWLRDDYLPIVCGVWAGGLVVWIFARAWRLPRS